MITATALLQSCKSGGGRTCDDGYEMTFYADWNGYVWVIPGRHRHSAPISHVVSNERALSGTADRPDVCATNHNVLEKMYQETALERLQKVKFNKIIIAFSEKISVASRARSYLEAAIHSFIAPPMWTQKITRFCLASDVQEVMIKRSFNLSEYWIVKEEVYRFHHRCLRFFVIPSCKREVEFERTLESPRIGIAGSSSRASWIPVLAGTTVGAFCALKWSQMDPMIRLLCTTKKKKNTKVMNFAKLQNYIKIVSCSDCFNLNHTYTPPPWAR